MAGRSFRCARVSARVAQSIEHGASNAGDKGENPFASANFRKAADISWLQSVLKPGSAFSRGRGNTDAFRHLIINERNPMKPVRRFQSQLLFRNGYKADRVIRISPAKLNFNFRPVRFGLKPKITTYECKSD